MFFWNRKKVSKHLNDMTEMMRSEDMFRAQLKDMEADQITPLEKLLKLELMKDGMQAQIDERNRKINEAAAKKSDIIFLGGGLSQSAAFITAAALTGIGPLALLAIPGIMAADMAGAKYGAAAKERLNEENLDFINALESRKEVISGRIKKTVEDNLEQIAGSALREEIFRNFPDIKIHFADAAAKKMAKNPPSPRPRGGKPDFNP